MSMFNCAECGEYTIQKITDTLIINQEMYCTECASEFERCTDCGEMVRKDNGYITSTGDFICDECYCNNYFTCEECGEVHHYEKSIRINPNLRYEKYVCDDCADKHYYKCDDCGEYFDSDYGYRDSNNKFLCDDCRENYYICDDCGEWVHDSDVYFDNRDNAYCSYCYSNHRNEFIYNYGDHPTLVKHSLPNELVTSKTLYFGFELEIKIDTDYAEEFLEFFNDDEIYLSYDSSVEGFEIVSHPMTWQYLNGDFKNRLEQALDFAKSVGAKGHNCGGMHIHISRDGISNKQIKAIEGLIYQPINSKLYQFIKTISQRKSSELHWCNFAKDTEKNQQRKIKSNKDYIYDKYTAINMQHNHTIEFRIFNSNLRIERVFKNLEFIKALLDFTKTNKTKTIKQFLVWIDTYKKYKYANLFNFLIEKNLINSKPVAEVEKDEVLQCA